MSDACNDIQALKNRQSDFKAKMLERRRQLEGLAAQLTSSGGAPSIVPPNLAGGSNSGDLSTSKALMKPSSTSSTISPIKQFQREAKVASDPEVEKKLLMVLCDISLDIPSDSKVIAEHTSRLMEREVDLPLIEELLRKFANQKLISIRFSENATGIIVNSLDLSKLSDVTKGHTKKRKRDSDDEEEEELGTKQARTSGPESRDIESLLSMQSTKEREEKKLNEEIQALLVTQTAKEQYLVEKFKSRGGPQLQEFCQYGTREECHRTGPDGNMCKRLHFKKIINKHTDESLGDCSFLNTCFHMDTCKETSNLQNCSMVPGSQHLTQGSMQQTSNQDWFYNFENSNHMNNSYGDPKRDMMTGKFYSTLSSSNVGHVTNAGFLPQASNNGLHNTVRPYPIAPRDDPLRSYASSNIPDNNVSMPPYQSAAIPETGDVSNSSFQQPNMPNSSNGRPYPDLNIARPTSARSYPPMTLPDSATASTSSVPDMTCPLPFPYASIPYSLTAPPPAPTASVVTTMGNCSGLDMVLPVISHSWSLSTETVFPTTMAMPSVPPTKPTKPKKLGGCGSSAAGKKRMRQPEKWKKNLSKTKKIKGEEHLSRTGNVIPAKRVEEVDCSQCTFKCNENFSYDLRQQLFDVFYSLGSNESQKQFVCQNVQETLTKVSGAGRKEGKFENKRKVSRKYFLPDTDNTRKQVCSKFFCGTLAVGKTFISHALRHKQFGCYVGKERRGKPHNKIPDDLLDPARQHIGSMLGVAVRGSKKSVKKKCLEQGLNITKMHEMYKDECAGRGISPVSLSMYRRVFHTEF